MVLPFKKKSDKRPSDNLNYFIKSDRNCDKTSLGGKDIKKRKLELGYKVNKLDV